MSKFLSGLFSKKEATPVNLSAIANSGANMMKTIKADKDNKEQVELAVVLTKINSLLKAPVPTLKISNNFERFCDTIVEDGEFKKEIIKQEAHDIVSLKNQYSFYIDKLKQYYGISLSNKTMTDTIIDFKLQLQLRVQKLNKVIEEIDSYITKHCQKKTSGLNPELKRRLNALRGATTGLSGGKRTRKYKRKTVRHTKKSKKTLRKH